MKKLYVLAALLLLQLPAIASINYGDRTNKFMSPPPDCELLTPASATATTGNAAAAIDGNAGTRWESAAEDPQSFTVDMGALVDINTITIDWETANAKDYNLLGSVNGTDWTLIEAFTNMPVGERTDISEAINAQYQYLKMEGIARNTPYGYSIWEFNVCSTAIEIPDCEPIMAASATATTGNAALAIDNNPATRWESAAEDPQNLTVDLGELQFVNEVSIVWEVANAKDYNLSGSVNGTDWVLIASMTDMAAGARTDLIDDINAEYQYLRMEGLTRTTPYGYSIWEFKVCGGMTEQPVECIPVDAISAVGSSGNGALAIDDDPVTRWESEFTDAQNLLVDMGEVKMVESVMIYWEAANAKDYNLEGTTDGVVWTTIESLTNMAEGERTDIIEVGAEYRFLRMQGVMRNTPYGYSIYEFDICGEEEIIVEPIECEPIDAISAVGSSGNGALAIDDDPVSRWESEFTDAQNLLVDLGEIKMVESVVIYWEAANAKDYNLEGTTDGIVWTTIESLTNMAEGERTDIIEVGAEYRFLRMQGIMRNTPYGYSIYEFDICGEEEVIVEPFECEPVAVAEASATTGNAALAVDDDPLSRWESEFSDAQSLTVDLGAVALVEDVVIYWETANAKDYTLSGSVDGTDWVLIETLNDMDEGERTDYIEDIDTEYRYLRMDGVLRNTPYGYSIYEFDVCGEAMEVEPEYTDIPALIQAEDYYEMMGVQTEVTADEGGGENLGFIDAGDWMEYGIDVPEAGTYTVYFRVASAVDGASIELMANGMNVGTVSVPNTGGWQVWQTVSMEVELTEGEQMARINAGGQFNLNWLEFVSGTSGLTGFNKSGVVVYPNPAQGYVNIKLDSATDVKIYNTYGALVKTVSATEGTNTIDLQDCAAGLYMVQVSNYTIKLLIK